MPEESRIHCGVTGRYRYSIMRLAPGEAPPVNEAGNSPPVQHTSAGRLYIDHPHAAWRKDLVRRRHRRGRENWGRRKPRALSDRNRKWAHKP